MNLTNHFLLPMPSIAGDYFSDSLTLICEHDSQGAMGLVVNKPTEVSLYELMSELGAKPHQSLLGSVVYDGGPVDTQRGFVLFSQADAVQDSVELMPGLQLTTSLDALHVLTQPQPSDPASTTCEPFIVALGYAGWAGGQLEDEIRNNVWLTMPASPDLIFGQPSAQRLNHAAQTFGVNLSLVANPGHA